MKQLIFIFLVMLMFNSAWAQGISKNGKITTTSAEYVDKNGVIGGSNGVDRNGKVVTAVVPLVIGANYQGGKIFYLFKAGEAGYIEGEIHGLITTPNLGLLMWGCNNTNIPGTTSGIGAGRLNTQIIVAACTEVGAAKICSDLSVTENGVVYDDWYLPSKDELTELTTYITLTNGWGNDSKIGWSSTQGATATNAWIFNSRMMELPKLLESIVRAVRSF